jgi:hypothetical protein
VVHQGAHSFVEHLSRSMEEILNFINSLIIDYLSRFFI